MVTRQASVADVAAVVTSAVGPTVEASSRSGGGRTTSSRVGTGVGAIVRAIVAVAGVVADASVATSVAVVGRTHESHHLLHLGKKRGFTRGK